MFNIARGADVPLRIHLAVENGIYARILVDVDYTSTIPNRILVKRKNINFFVEIEYKNLPMFCTNYVMIGHNFEEYRERNGIVPTRTEGFSQVKVQE